MKALTWVALVLFGAFATTAVAAPQSQRVRGTIQSSGQNSITVKSRSGNTVKVMLNGGTKYVWVVKSSLSKVSQHDYVGVATKKVGNSLEALELVIFPPSMRGAGEGHYPWDKLADTTRSRGGMTASSMTNGSVGGTSSSGTMTQSAMTNGTVTNASESLSMTQSAMTNGSVRAVNHQARGEQVTVKYQGGQKKITIPPSAPIVAFKPAHRSALKQGAHVFISAKREHGQLVAKMVAIGKNGLNPPM